MRNKKRAAWPSARAWAKPRPGPRWNAGRGRNCRTRKRCGAPTSSSTTPVLPKRPGSRYSGSSPAWRCSQKKIEFLTGETMRPLRPILLAIFLVAAFYFITNRLSGPLGPSWVTRPSHVELTEAAGPGSYDAEEQNNIAVYKKALPSVVNITSTAVAFDFFYGPVPQQGMGSGFVIDSEGHIL